RKGSDYLLSGKALLVLMEAVLQQHRPFRFQARGFSMAPFIRDGDILTITPFTTGRPQWGKVAAFIDPRSGLPILHRIIGIRKLAFLTKGDNPFNQSDGWIPRKNLLGLVTEVKREGKKVRLGMGPERFLIALWSRMGVWRPAFWLWRKRRGASG
ncbi:MAG: hypothetical protein AB1585_10445, partial [Thermodesulfobacteriota bacterium]